MGVVTEWKEADLTGFFPSMEKFAIQPLSKALRNICKVMMNIYWEKKQVDNNNRQIRVLPVIRFFAAWDFSFPFFWEIQRSTANRDHPSIKCTKKCTEQVPFPFHGRKKNQSIRIAKNPDQVSATGFPKSRKLIKRERKKKKPVVYSLNEWLKFFARNLLIFHRDLH